MSPYERSTADNARVCVVRPGLHARAGWAWASVDLLLGGLQNSREERASKGADAATARPQGRGGVLVQAQAARPAAEVVNVVSLGVRRPCYAHVMTTEQRRILGGALA